MYNDNMNAYKINRRRADNQRNGYQPQRATKSPTRKPGEKFRELEARIDIETQPMDFSTKSWIVSQDDLSHIINGIFRNVSPQFAGSKIVMTNTGLMFELYFNYTEHVDESSGQIRFLKRVNEVEKGKSAENAVRLMSTHNKNAKIFELTQAGKDALSEFVDRQYIVGDPADNNYNWSKLEYEVKENTAYNEEIIYTKVIIDPRRLLAKMYGKKNPDTGSNWVYMIVPQMPIPGYAIQMGNGNQAVAKYILNITQIDAREIDKISQQVYQGAFSGTLGINRS